MILKTIEESIADLEKLKGKKNTEIADALTLGMCQLTDSTISYFALYDSIAKNLTMIGWSKSAMTNCAIINKPIVYKLDDTGLWGDAIRERKAVITNDYKNLVKPTKKGYPKGHVMVRRHMNLPIMESGRIVLVAGIGNKKDDYTKIDVQNIEKYMNAAYQIIKATKWG